MANIIFGGGASFNSSATIAVPGSPPLQASVGTVSSITVGVNTAIQNFYPFSSVQYGISPYTYSVSSGTLPTGITLDSTTGLVSGTPTATQAVSNVVFRVTDSLGVVSSTTATVAFTINGTITATANSITPVSITVNQSVGSFNPFASVTGGTTPYYYFVSSGQLPERVTLDSTTGLVTGTPTEPYSTATVTFSVRDAGGIVAATTSTVSFTVNAAFVATAGATTTVLGYQSSAITSFNPFSSVAGGYTPYVYGIVSGTLPTGITLNTSTGLVSGTPSATYATANVTFRVTDAQGYVAATTTTVSFTVNATITATAGATTTVSQTVNTTITSFNPFSSVTGGYTPYTYYVSSGTLPTGITINSSTGLVSGTPTIAQGAASVTFSVRDVNNVVASTTSTVSFSVTSATYNIQYLVVAGGGAGGSSPCLGFAGGGGGGGGVLIGTLTNISVGTPINISVGYGGLAAGSAGNGIASSMTSPVFSTITAIGGGGGAGQGAANAAGFTGGSGGGSYWNNATGLATGSSGQGIAGTQGYPGGGSSPSTFASGGGGANAAGLAGSTGGGAGGVGRAWPFTGPAYAGGGGGGSSTPTVGTGGGGGGGNGGTPASTNGVPGTVNTGGGGGGANYGSPGTRSGGNGGPGVVIIAVPNAQYPATTRTGAIISNPGSAPGLTVLTYVTPSPTTSGSYTFIA